MSPSRAESCWRGFLPSCFKISWSSLTRETLPRVEERNLDVDDVGVGNGSAQSAALLPFSNHECAGDEDLLAIDGQESVGC